MASNQKLELLLELFVNYAFGRDDRVSPYDKRKLITRLRNNKWADATPSEYKVKNVLDPILSTLYDSKGDVRFKDGNKETILHHFLVDYTKTANFVSDFQSTRDCKVVEYLTKEGASVLASDYERNTPLEIAVSKKRLDLVRIMLPSVNDTNGKTKTFVLIAHLAAKNCDIETLQMLKRKKLFLDVQSVEGDNLLMSLCRNINKLKDISLVTKTVKWLLNEDCDVNLKDKRGFTALHYASRTNMLNVVKDLVEAGSDVDAKALDNNRTPLFCAAVDGSFEVMRHLIERAKDIECKDDKYGFNLLHVVSYNLDKRKFDLVIERGLDVNCPAKDGETPLHLASLQGNAKVVEELRRRGAQCNCQCQPWRYTPLHLASLAGQFQYMKPGLLDKLKYIKSRNIIRESLIEKPNYKVTIDALLELSNPSCNIKDKLGWTPIYYTIRRNDELLTCELLKSGASLDVQDSDCLLPLHYALKCKNQYGNYSSIVERLIEFGADINEIEFPNPGTFKEIFVRDNNLATELIRQAVTLKMVRLPIHKVYEPFINIWQMENHRINCLNEIEKLKSYMVEEGLSLYDLLHSSNKKRCMFYDRLSIYHDHPLVKRKEFLIYYDVVQANIVQAYKRQFLQDNAGLYFNRITNINWPYLCLELIFSYLSNRHLRVLFECAQMP